MLGALLEPLLRQFRRGSLTNFAQTAFSEIRPSSSPSLYLAHLGDAASSVGRVGFPIITRKRGPTQPVPPRHDDEKEDRWR
jgi:hypothetical protein